jgi:hypothetical protein
LSHAQALVHVEEYAQVVCALAPNIHATPLVETIAALRHFHPLAEVDLPLFVNDFHPKTDHVLDREALIFSLTCSPRLSLSGPLGMVYEFLQYCFITDDFIGGFEFFFEICRHINCGHVPPLVYHV